MLAQNLNANGALACHYVDIVKRRNIGVAVLFDQLLGMLGGGGKGITF